MTSPKHIDYKDAALHHFPSVIELARQAPRLYADKLAVEKVLHKLPKERVVLDNGFVVHNAYALSHEVLAYEPPAPIRRLEAMLMMYSTDSESIGDSFHTLLGDAAHSYELLRVTRKDKEKLLDWIYNKSEEIGRNRWEKATLVPQIIGGYNSLCAAEFDPVKNVGAVGSIVKMVRAAIHHFNMVQDKRVLLPSDVDVLDTIINEIGLPAEKFKQLHGIRYVSELVRKTQMRTTLKQAYESIGQVSNVMGLTEVCLISLDSALHEACEEDFIDSRSRGTTRYSYNPNMHVVENLVYVPANTIAAFYYTAGNATLPEDKLDELVDDIIKRYGSKLQGRKAR